jgi:hypothetical protein
MARRAQTPAEIAARRGLSRAESRGNGDCHFAGLCATPRDCPRFPSSWNVAGAGDTSAMRPSRRSVDVSPPRDCPLSCHSQIALEFTAQTTVRTGPQVKPREPLQEACQVPSAETSPIALQLNLQVAVAFGPPILDRNAPHFAVRFALQVASRTTVRTTLGTVPGTVPTVVPGRSILARSTATNASLRCYLAGLGLTQWC